ncbi:MAG: hypothetical protein JWQ43_501 [Glaciihabitans sp.]|nr:hypothetical protein [Glaciihabitans sp.]
MNPSHHAATPQGYTTSARLLRRSLSHLRALPVRYIVTILVVDIAVTLGLGKAVAALVDGAIAAAHVPGLSDRNLLALLAAPAPLALVALIAVMLSAATLGTAVMVFVIADLQLAGVAPSLRALGKRSASALRTLLRPETLLLSAQLVLLAPFAGFGLFSPLTSGLGLPPFIEREFEKSLMGTLAWNAVMLVLLYLTFRSILTLPLSVVTGARPARSFLTGLRSTNRAGHLLAVVFAIAFGGFWLVSRAAAELLAQLVDAAEALLPGSTYLMGVAAIVLSLLTPVATMLFALLLVGHSRDISGLPSLRRGPARGGARARRRTPVLSWRVRVAGAVVMVSLVISGATVAASAAAGTGTPGDALVVGHRGSDTGGVENTIGGLEAAVRLDPDYVEMDVQQTADGDFVVSHDSNLLVLAGINSNIFDMTTAEVTGTTVRAHGHSDTIPTMVEYVRRAAELGMPLMIEFKVTGHESTGFVADAVAELQSVGDLQDNVYHSIDPGVVRELKKLHPELRVGLTIGMLHGNPPKLDCDFYVIEQASFTTQFLGDAHAAGREVYVWTVNGSVTMRSLLRDGVDGLITDRIAAAQTFSNTIIPGSGYDPGDARDLLLLEVPWE